MKVKIKRNIKSQNKFFFNNIYDHHLLFHKNEIAVLERQTILLDDTNWLKVFSEKICSSIMLSGKDAEILGILKERREK